MCIWLVLTFGMITPPAVRTKMYHLNDLNGQQATTLAQKVSQMTGVYEAVAIAQEQLLIVKVNNQQSNDSQALIEQNILKLIGADNGIS
jgi:hypothetical protein